MLLEIHIKLCVTEPKFLKLFFLPPKWTKWPNNDPKIGCLKIIKKSGHLFFLNLF